MTPSTEGKLRKALALANSMILSGEQHSETSRKIISEALSTPPTPVDEGNEEIAKRYCDDYKCGLRNFSDGSGKILCPQCIRMVEALSAKDAEKAVVRCELDKHKKAIYDIIRENEKVHSALTKENSELREKVADADRWRKEALEFHDKITYKNEALTTSNRGLVEALVRIVKEATDPEERWANSKKVAQQALQQFGGGV